MLFDRRLERVLRNHLKWAKPSSSHHKMAMLRYMIFNYHHYRAIIPHKSLSTPLFPFQFSHNFTTSDSDSFTVSYLINTIGFPRETALKASKRLRFNSPQKPNSVFTFFTNKSTLVTFNTTPQFNFTKVSIFSIQSCFIFWNRALVNGESLNFTE